MTPLRPFSQLGSAAFLSLQRTAGNEAVTAAIVGNGGQARYRVDQVPEVQRQEAPESQEAAEAQDVDEGGIEVGGLVQLMPQWRVVALSSPGEDVDARSPSLQRDPMPTVQRAGCDAPASMRAVRSGTFEGGKKLDDYYPDLVGTNSWGSSNTAGPFDNGYRAGSAVQLIGEYPMPCTSAGPFTFHQTVTVSRMRGDGKKLMEGGRPAEGRTYDDIARSGRDFSRPPTRQVFGNAVTMADPISGAPYSMFKSYELVADLTSSISGPGGRQSVNWGVTVESSGGRVTRNDIR